MPQNWKVIKQGVAFDATIDIESENNNEQHFLCLTVTAKNNSFFGAKVIWANAKAVQKNGDTQYINPDMFKVYGKLPVFFGKPKSVTKKVRERFQINLEDVDVDVDDYSSDERITILDKQIKNAANELNDLRILLQGEDLTKDSEYLRILSTLNDLKQKRKTQLSKLTFEKVIESVKFDITFTVVN